MPNDEVKLAGCPFCGGKAHLQENGIAGARYWEVVCYEPCDFCGPAHDTRDAAITAWNRRAIPSTVSGETDGAMLERAAAGFESGITAQTQDYNFKHTSAGWLFRCGDETTKAEAIAAWNKRTPDVASLVEEVRELREANAWRPIETAPKDGTWILAQDQVAGLRQGIASAPCIHQHQAEVRRRRSRPASRS